MIHDGRILSILLYADKSDLSSSGMEKGYPIIARVMNLDLKIRNGHGISGGRVVGWLPVVHIKITFVFVSTLDDNLLSGQLQ